MSIVDFTARPKPKPHDWPRPEWSQNTASLLINKQKSSLTKQLETHCEKNVHCGDSSQELCVIGLTGTNGKTTVAYLIGEVLKLAGHHPFVLGTFNSGNKDLSTPELQDTLRMMRDHLNDGGTHFIMEVTSEGIDQGRVAGIDFDLKILTNITEDHLDYHKTFKQYQKTKMGFMDEGDAHKIYPKGFEAEPIDFTTQLLGEYNLLNIRAATSALRHIGISEQCIQKTLSACPAPRGRLEVVDEGQPYMVLVDYAHTADGLLNVLQTLKEVAVSRNGKLLVLFGCGGDRDNTKRPKMGGIASEIADFWVIADDNPRSEYSHDIISDIMDGVASGAHQYAIIPDRGDAIRFIISKAHKNDVVILAGKGHETYQVLGNETIHFDDCEEAAHAILAQPKTDIHTPLENENK